MEMRGVGRFAVHRSASWVLSAVGVGLSVHACAVDKDGYEFGDGSGGSAGSGAAGGLAGAGAGLAGAGTSGRAAGGATASGGSNFGGSAPVATGGGGGEVEGACGAVVCASQANCVKTAESAKCQCPSGYLDVRGDGSSCEDIDECASENGGCDALVPCQNTPGGSSCGDCPPGYTAEGGECVDIDECAEANGDCDALAECTNTPGSFSCGNCPFGFEADAKGTCTDIDECATNNGGCDASAACNNTDGGFTCGDCPAGYSGGGDTGCVDIDECATNEGGCDPLAGCTNKAGGFSCGECPAGYAGSGAGGCVDIDECATNNGGCDVNAACTDLDGSRTCACKAGYSGNGTTCADVNECATSNGGCHANADCTNAPGSRTCSCKAGYSGDGTTCADIDECATNNGGCHASADCANSPGSRSCTCKDGYTGNGTACTCAVTTPQCVNSTTQRSCSGNTLTQTTCTGPSPLCVNGQGCQSCNTVRCGTTCCAPPPANATAICNPSTTCSVKCNTNYHACSGTQSPCYMNNDPLHCGDACVNCTQPNANAICTDGVCKNTCKGSKLTCSGVDGKPVCGSWSFESSVDPTEGFRIDEATTTAYGGPLRAVNRRAAPGAGSYSLAIDYDGLAAEGVVDVKFQLCPSGTALNLSNYLLSMRLYAETDFSVSDGFTANGNYVTAYNGSEYVYGGCDSFTPDSDVNFDWECSDSSFPTTPINTIVLRFRVFEPWKGTFYIDNVRLDPK
jgi:hypothetical protein